LRITDPCWPRFDTEFIKALIKRRERGFFVAKKLCAPDPFKPPASALQHSLALQIIIELLGRMIYSL